MPDDKPRIVPHLISMDHQRIPIEIPVGFRFLLQVSIGPTNEVMGQVSFNFPFEALVDGALDGIIEAIGLQLRLAADTRKKRIAAENS